MTESNLVEFFKWGLLGIGAYYNVTIPTSGVYGGNWHQLRQAEDPNYPAGSVWEAARQDWVWESGVPFNPQPIQVSGVYVNGSFLPLASGVHVDYPLGRILLDNPLPASSTVTCEYSFRAWQVTPSKVDWFREVQFDSFRIDDSQFQQYGSGAWSILAENRVQLPALVVQVTPRRRVVGHALGGEIRHYPQVVFHVFAEEQAHLTQMVDIVTDQIDVTLDLFDKNKMADANAFPLTFSGEIASGALTYPQLIQQFPWYKLTFMDFTAPDSVSAPPLYNVSVLGTVEVILPP